MKVSDDKTKIYYISELYCLVSIMLIAIFVIKEDIIRYMINDDALFYIISRTAI